MENKVKIIINKNKNKEVVLNGEKVIIKTFISIEDYEIILDDIKEVVFYNHEIVNKAHLIDLRLIRDILNICTNIDVDSLDVNYLYSSEIRLFLDTNIENIKIVKDNIEKEYNKFVLENCFGILANRLPSGDEIDKSMEKLSKTINDIPNDKLELIGKSIIWNNMPSLGKVVAPAEHQSLSAEV